MGAAKKVRDGSESRRLAVALMAITLVSLEWIEGG
jgi:hypothetical protein